MKEYDDMIKNGGKGALNEAKQAFGHMGASNDNEAYRQYYKEIIRGFLFNRMENLQGWKKILKLPSSAIWIMINISLLFSPMIDYFLSRFLGLKGNKFAVILSMILSFAFFIFALLHSRQIIEHQRYLYN